MSTFNLGN